MSNVTTALPRLFDWRSEPQDRRRNDRGAASQRSAGKTTKAASIKASGRSVSDRTSPSATPGAAPSQPKAEAAQVRRDFWSKMAHFASGLPFAEDAAAAYFAAFDKDTPLKVRVALVGVLAYFILPMDAIPDVVPALGFSDDAAMLVGAVKLLGEHITPSHRAAARARLESLRQK